MQALPVPALEQTLDRYLHTVRPLLDDAEFAATCAAVADTARADGPACQEELERWAQAAAAQGTSWLTAPWLDGYLVGRGPLPLTTSVALQVRLPSAGGGTAGAADALHRLVRVHLDAVRGELAPELDGRGQQLDDSQRTVLAGGLRRPGRDVDTVHPGDADPADRCVLVLHAGHGFALRVSDERGRALSAAALRLGLDTIVATGGSDDVPFTAWSYLDRAKAWAYESEVLAHPEGAATHGVLERALFGVTLLDDATTTEAHLFDTAFRRGRAWTGLPITYQLGLADEARLVHFEHSVADGATVSAVIRLAQAVDVDAAPAGEGVAAVRPLSWPLTDELRARITADLDDYRDRVARLRLRLVRVPVPAADDLAFAVSRDAAVQFALQYAQLAATGRIDTTYESVDMRAYAGGRTEALRPVTSESVALVRAMLDGRADEETLRRALGAHRERVIRCKTGQAVDRHLLGLRLAADRLVLRPAIFEDAAYGRLGRDALSTTSLGGDDAVSLVAFAPTTPGGLGVYYSVRDGEDVLAVTHDDSRDADIDAFLEQITDGARRLWSLALSR